jgi:hypothetical protein
MKRDDTHPELDYHYITAGIYIGTNQCCQTHFNEELLTEGISADISLEDGRLDQPFGVKFYVWLPVKNHAAPSQEQLEFGVAVLEQLVRLKKKVYVHCKNGHGRAPTLVAAYLMKRGKTAEKAVAMIKNKRSSVHIETAQREALRTFEILHQKHTKPAAGHPERRERIR